MSDANTLTREIEIKILANTYKVNFPKTGQLIRIQTNKLLLGNGVYQDLLVASSDALYVRFLIDSIATFQILIPQLSKDLTVDIMELDLMQSKEIVSAYTDQYLPWYNKWTKLVQGDDQEEVKDPAESE